MNMPNMQDNAPKVPAKKGGGLKKLAPPAGFRGKPKADAAPLIEGISSQPAQDPANDLLGISSGPSQ